MVKHFLISHWKTLKTEAEQTLTAARTFLLRTDTERWRKVAAEIPSWDGRNQLIATFIPSGASVLDLGAGSQSLAGHLAHGCHYQPCDVVKSTQAVLLCDFNSGRYPDIQQQYDFVVCSGLLEYLRDIDTFLRVVMRYGRILIVSYACRQPSESKFARARHGWLNHFTRTELQTKFAASDLECSEIGVWKGQVIFLLTSSSLPLSPPLQE